MEPSLDHQLIFNTLILPPTNLLQHVSYASLQPTSFSPYSFVAFLFVVPGVQRLGEQLQSGRGRVNRQQLHDSQRGVYLAATLQSGDTPDGNVVPEHQQGNQWIYPPIWQRLTHLVAGVFGLDERDPCPLLRLPQLGRDAERPGLSTGHSDGSPPRASKEEACRSQRKHPL